tara:strand:- start:556 stop:1161 length:606 start_codon:yes stop_codon:yes gene_type:complete
MSYARKRLERLERNKRRIIDAINRTPRAPPGLGLPGQAFNVLRAAPKPFVDASSLAFQNEALLRAVVAYENQLLEQRVSIPGIAIETLRPITPSLDELETIFESLGDEKLLNQKTVDSIIKDIDTGRDVIRASGQFDLQNLLPRFKETVKRTRKKTKTDKNMSSALRQANARFRTAKGKLRKGATQSQIMKFAHRLLRKMK